MTEPLTPYRELAEIVEQLGPLTKHTRRSRGQTLRMAADAIGTDAATLLRLENGSGVQGSLIPKVLRWMDERK